MATPDKLTRKQEGFIKDYLETGNGTEAALRNYDAKTDNMAAVIAYENLRKPLIIEAIKSIAESIPDETLLEVHLEGLKATKKIFKDKDEDGVEEVDEPDHAIRHKYLDSAYKIKGSYAPEKSINLNVEATITDPNARALAEKYEEELKKSL